MKSAQQSFIVQYRFRIDGANLVFKLCHQYEEKILSLDGPDSREFSRGRDYPRIAQAGTDFP